MSMHDYGFEDYGIILYRDEVIELAKKYVRKNFTEDVYNDMFTDGNGNELNNNDINIFDCQEIVDSIVEYVSEFSGESRRICDDVTDTDGDCYCGDVVRYIPMLRIPSLFSLAYNNFSDMVKEHREHYAEYLPDDFPLEERFAHIVGAYFG